MSDVQSPPVPVVTLGPARAIRAVFDLLPQRVGEAHRGAFSQFALAPDHAAELRHLADTLDQVMGEGIAALDAAIAKLHGGKADGAKGVESGLRLLRDRLAALLPATEER